MLSLTHTHTHTLTPVSTSVRVVSVNLQLGSSLGMVPLMVPLSLQAMKVLSKRRLMRQAGFPRESAVSFILVPPVLLLILPSDGSRTPPPSRS